MTKVVLDTNVWLSAIFWEGEASRIVELSELEKIRIIISRNMVFEIMDVLGREKFQRLIEERKYSMEDLLKTVVSLSVFVTPQKKVPAITTDPKDNIILEAAIEGDASYIISYDKHILDLIEFEGVKILDPGTFLELCELPNR